MNINIFTVEFLQELAGRALVSPRKRQHQNIHAGYSEPCQRLFNAIEPDSYIRPHMHGPFQGPEMIIAIRGLLKLVAFDRDGGVDEVVIFGTERYSEAKKFPVGMEVLSGRWHTVVAMDPGAILLEVKAGPFNPSASKFLAPWAPEEGSREAVSYFKGLLTKI